MLKKAAVSVLCSLFFLSPAAVRADVYPFEEDYNGAGSAQQNMTVAQENDFHVQQSVVTSEDREEAKQVIAEENSRDSYLKNRTITWNNIGEIAINFVNGIGLVYHDLGTRALPEYGADLASIPGGSVSLAGKFVELERQAVFEHNAKEKDIQEYIDSQQKPLTPEEERLLKDLRGKPISSAR